MSLDADIRKFEEITGLPHPDKWGAITDSVTRMMLQQAEADAFQAGLRPPFVMYDTRVDKDDYDEWSDRRVEAHKVAREQLLAEHPNVNPKRCINRTYYDGWCRWYWVFAIGEATSAPKP